MAFGMTPPPAHDFVDIVKFDANAGRLFRIDYDINTREKVPVDITVPPPKFAFDFGTLQLGYAHFAPDGPDYRLVPEGKELPAQPPDRDEKGRPKFRFVFKAQLYGKILGGIREWSSAANCVHDAVDDLYQKFKAAPEAWQGKIPIVTLTKTLPISVGKGARKRTLYAPCFVITDWTDRVPDMGERIVPAPVAATVAQTATPNWTTGGDLDDEIPF